MVIWAIGIPCIKVFVIYRNRHRSPLIAYAIRAHL